MYRAECAKEAVAPAAAEQPVSEGERAYLDLTHLTLPGFVEFALSNRPDVVEARLAVSNAYLKLVSVSSEEYPFIDLSGGYSRGTHNSGPHFCWRQTGDADAQFAFSLLLCDFGRLDAQERAAREGIVAAQRDYANKELLVFEEVARTYFTLLQQDALLAVAATNEMQYAEHLKQAETLFSAGEVKKLDVLKARLDLSDAQLTTIRASNDVVIASADFIRALGLEADGADRLDILPPADDCFQAAKRELPVSTEDALAALAFARTNAPSLMVARAKLRVAAAQVDYAVADLLPSLSLDANFNYVDPVWNFHWGISAVQSLFQGYRKTTAVDSAVVDMLAAREAVSQAEQQLSYDLSVATATRDTARQSLETALVQIKQARENLDTVVAEYRLGEASRIDFTDAVSAYSTAEGARVKAFYTGQIAEAGLVRLTGKGVDFQ